MGVATNPVFVQDLAIWRPAAVVVALGLWRRRPWAALRAGAVLVFWFLESVGLRLTSGSAQPLTRRQPSRP